MEMELMYVACGAIILVFIIVMISCRLIIRPYKDQIIMLKDRIKDLEAQQTKETKTTKKKTETKKEEED